VAAPLDITAHNGGVQRWRRFIAKLVELKKRSLLGTEFSVSVYFTYNSRRGYGSKDIQA
jgi:hypothetical protein